MTNFQDLGLRHELLRAVEALGFNEPMPIQAEVIPALIAQPSDLVGLAQTGTGKTAAFGLPVLHHINPTLQQTQAVVLCPTRELCLQITRDLSNFAKFMQQISITPVYGGASIEKQLRELARQPHIIVATPGRLNDMIRRGKTNFGNVQWVVLDEADEMLDMGFQEDVDTILQTMPEEHHTLLFSATMPEEVEAILNKYMQNPAMKSVGKRNTGTANVKHMYYMVQARDRYAALKRVADFNPAIYAIVFCRTRAETQEIADNLIRDGYNADALHGDLSQAQRDHVMNRFRQGTLQMLVATDVAARGLDVNNLTHVINYNLPDEPEVYIHRSGRTGRADKTGICISIIHTKEKSKLRIIERKVGREFALAKVPTGVQVCEKQLFHHIDRMEKVEVNHEEIDAFLPVIFRKLEWMSREDIIRRFVSLEFNRFLEYYRNAPDLNVEERGGEREYRDKGRPARGDRSDDKGRFTRLFVSLGKRDGTGPHNIIGLINEVTRSRDVNIGRIDIMENFSFVDIDNRHVDLVVESFANKQRNRSGVRVNPADPKDGPKTPARSGKPGGKKARRF